MRSKAIISDPNLVADPKLGEIHARLFQKWQGFQPPLPEELIGDLILALVDPLPDVKVVDAYSDMMHQIVKGGCWMQIVRRLDYRRAKNEAALDYLADLFCDRLWRIGNSLSFLPNEESVQVNGTDSDDETARDEATEEQSVTPKKEPAKATGGDWLEQLATLYLDRLEGHVDYSSGLVDAFAFVALNLALRAWRVEALHEWMDEPLVKACLGVEWDPLSYEPRLLRIVTRLGDEDEALPGDILSVRGVTKKTREDQIPRILPSELGLWIRGETGRRFTMDKIINRSPSIYEHFDTRHPENRHRAYLMFILDLQKEDFASAKEDDAIWAVCQGKALFFDLLMNASLHMPETIAVDVGWFERRKRMWIARGFRLKDLETRLTHEEAEGWRNLTRLDGFLPHFFIRALAGQREDFAPRSKHLAGEPKDHLARALQSGHYESVLVATLAPLGQEIRSLPPPTLSLPRPDPTMNTVLLAAMDAPKSDARPVADLLYGEACRDLLAARLTPKPLNAAQPEDLSFALLEMLVGPAIRQKPPVAV